MASFLDLNTNKLSQFIFDKPGEYVVFFHNLSGKFSFEITGSGVELFIYGLFTGKQADQFKVETIQHHRAPNSWSDLLIKGVFEDQSKLLYQGLIRIEKEGKGSHAYQKNQNLMLSPQAFVDSRPFLEILANDVFCTHGSTTGQLNEEQLFYAQSRGLTPENARQLLVDGFIGELIDKVHIKAPDAKISF